jgi:hypothetical protein
VLAGIAAAATYCYLLAAEEHRDGGAWAAHLLDLQAQGPNPDYTIADAGTGLRAGQKLAWPGTRCHADVFHIHQQFEALVTIWARIASGVCSERETLEARRANPRQRCQDSLLIARLAEALPRSHGRISSLRTFRRLPVCWSATSWHWRTLIWQPVMRCSLSCAQRHCRVTQKARFMNHAA